MIKSKAVALEFRCIPDSLIGGHLLSGFEYLKRYKILKHNTRTGYCIEKDGASEWLSHSLVKRYFRKIYRLEEEE